MDPKSSPLPNFDPPSPELGHVRGLDIGCGANLIYCLLGASLYDWHMVGADITPAALTWAHKLVSLNPHLAHLLEFSVCVGGAHMLVSLNPHLAHLLGGWGEQLPQQPTTVV